MDGIINKMQYKHTLAYDSALKETLRLATMRMKLEGMMITGIVTKPQLLYDFIINKRKVARFLGEGKKMLVARSWGEEWDTTVTGSLFQ